MDKLTKEKVTGAVIYEANEGNILIVHVGGSNVSHYLEVKCIRDEFGVSPVIHKFGSGFIQNIHQGASLNLDPVTIDMKLKNQEFRNSLSNLYGVLVINYDTDENVLTYELQPSKDSIPLVKQVILDLMDEMRSKEVENRSQQSFDFFKDKYKRLSPEEQNRFLARLLLMKDGGN